ncbi:acetamidase/formamidase [Carboxydothermus islandicus]|uniref:Acetamidase/formamidase n=1 Tax=Carboxydothermus islandicus TaxID=661089 RepID=A0A1L8CZB7_9THEO|nr:acetamidase/formamidase family protein [Carboxydothermus islandicus]GAV24286.1 acetamidase/formamidase [Carboxydothermus islandicus]
MFIKNDQVIYSFKPENKPVAEVENGSIITFQTCDCFANQIISSEQSIDSLDWNRVNPATGPVFIRGAEPGDSLKVSILKIKLANSGVMAAIPGFGVLGKRVEKASIKIIPINENVAYFNDLLLTVKPMIGVIGVAPKEGEFPCGTPGKHGGNLDTNLVCEGNEIILPVNVPGALLALGDIHARMGDGEVWVTGIETAAEVTVKVEVLKNFKVSEPVIINDDIVAFLASADTLDEAVEKATQYGVDVLTDLGLDLNEAGMLLSAVGDLQISQVVDPLKTARLVMPRWILTKYGLKIE